MATPPDDQADAEGDVGSSKRGDTIRAKMLQLQTRIEVLRKEAKDADRLAAAAIKRRKLLTKAKTVGGGFLFKIPAAMWTDELRAAFRIGAVNCRTSDKEAWSVLLADLEKAWFAQPDDKKAASTSERSSLETEPMDLPPLKRPRAIPKAELTVKASQPPEAEEAPSDSVPQSPPTEVPPALDAAASQSDAAASSPSEAMDPGSDGVFQSGVASLATAPDPLEENAKAGPSDLQIDGPGSESDAGGLKTTPPSGPVETNDSSTKLHQPPGTAGLVLEVVSQELSVEPVLAVKPPASGFHEVSPPAAAQPSATTVSASPQPPADPMDEAITAQQFFKLTYRGRQRLIVAQHPVLLHLAEQDISGLEFGSEQKKIRATQAEMRKAHQP